MKTPPQPRAGAPGALPPPPQDQVALLAEHLQAAWAHTHRARLKGVALGLLGLSVASRVNLTKVARACAGPAQVGSHYRRLQRLRAGFALLGGDGPLAPVIAGLSGLLPPWPLSLDRTTWKPFAVAGPRLPWVNFLV